MANLRIAIDGPAASGKSTTARLLAARLGGYYVNTGDMYRAVTWAAQCAGIDPATDPDAVAALLPRLTLEYRPAAAGTLTLWLNGEPAPREAIRAPAVVARVSEVARIPAVREWLRPRQRRCAEFGTVVMEGRDIGTVILPDAEFKFFVTASPEVRARRRLAQPGEAPPGATVASVAAEIARRDRIDSTRALAPLRPAADALVIATDELTPDQVVDRLMAAIAMPRKS